MPDYKVLSVLFCDDVRTEQSGKDILIGVYNRIMRVDRVPTLLPTFSTRIEIKLRKLSFDKVHFRVIRPDKSTAFEFNRKANFTNINAPGLMAFVIIPFNITAAGTYTALFGMDSPARRIATFDVEVRTPPKEH